MSGADAPAYVPPVLGKDWFAAARKEDIATLKKLHEAAGEELTNYCGKGTSYGFVGNSALHWAAARNNVGMAKWLVSVGARVDIGNADEATPLHSAASNNSLAMAEYLLEQGADTTVKDGLDETARDAASRRGFMGVVRKIDALAGAGKLRALCAELSALPVEQWRVKQMKALLLQSGELASADGITEKDQLRELVRKVLGTHKPADGAWYAPSTPAAARPAAPAAINSTQPPPPPVTTAAPSSEGAKPVDRAGAAAGAGGGAGKSKRKKKRGGKPRPAADKSDSSDTGKMDTGATGSRKAGSGNADTGIADGGKVVSGKAASGKVDTGIADSGEVESGTANSGKVDTGKLDTGTVDSGEGATANELAAALRLQAAAAFSPDDEEDASRPRVIQPPAGAVNKTSPKTAPPVDSLSDDSSDASDGGEGERQEAAAAAAKDRGNLAFGIGDFSTALKQYSVAIRLDPRAHVLFSNRSACHAALGNGLRALEDARECVRLNPQWAKGHGRVGAAMLMLGEFKKALEAYETGLSFEPANESLAKSADDARAALANLNSGGNGGASNAGANTNSERRPRSPPPAHSSVEHLPIEGQWIEHAKNGTLGAMRRLLAIDPALLPTQTGNALGHTALHWAAARNKPEVAKWLIEQGLDANVLNKVGAAPLHSAVAHGCADLVELLAKKGADLTLRNSSDESARDIAEARGYPRIFELLEKLRGGSPSPSAQAQPPANGGLEGGNGEPGANGGPGRTRKAAMRTREGLRHMSYEQLIDLVLELQAE